MVPVNCSNSISNLIQITLAVEGGEFAPTVLTVEHQPETGEKIQLVQLDINILGIK